MHIHVNGRNIEITDAIKAYVKEKAGKVAAHYEQIDSIDAILTVIKNPSVSESHIAEINCKIGLKKYIDYCKKNNITKEKIDKFTDSNVPNIMTLFNKQREEER